MMKRIFNLPIIHVVLCVFLLLQGLFFIFAVFVGSPVFLIAVLLDFFCFFFHAYYAHELRMEIDEEQDSDEQIEGNSHSIKKDFDNRVSSVEHEPCDQNESNVDRSRFNSFDFDRSSFTNLDEEEQFSMPDSSSIESFFKE